MENSERPFIKYVEIVTLDSPFQADILQEALKTEGIEPFVVSYDDTRMEKIVVPQKGWGVLSVPINMADRAKEVIDTYMASVKEGIVTNEELAEMAQEEFPEEILKGIEDDKLEADLEEAAVLKKAREHPHSEDTFEEIYTLENYFQAEALSNFLHQEGIDVIIQSYQRTRLELVVTPQKGWGMLMVPSEHAEKAREIIENFEANLETEAASEDEKGSEGEKASEVSEKGEEEKSMGDAVKGAEGEGKAEKEDAAEDAGEKGAEGDGKSADGSLKADALEEDDTEAREEDDTSKPPHGRPRKKRRSDDW